MGVFIADRLAGVDVDPSHFHRSILPGLRRIYVSLLSQCFPILARFEGQQTRANKSTGHIVAIKNIVIPLEVEYLQRAAKERGISRSKLVRFVMEKVVNDELVAAILGDDDLSNVEPPSQRYRRFQDRA